VIGPRRNQAILASLIVLVAGMTALSFASVPLYRLFCQVTGYGGTPQIATVRPDTVGEREITVRFNSDVDPKLPWAFQPLQRAVKVKVGEEKLAFFQATNRSDKPLVGTATFNVTPLKAGLYFNKIQCFCFDEQRLDPGESADMPVSFFIDPEILKDPNLNDVQTITLSYTFFRSLSAREEEEGDGGLVRMAASTFQALPGQGDRNALQRISSPLEGSLNE